MGQVEGVHRRVTGLRNGGNGMRGATGVRHRGTSRGSGIWGEPKLDGVQLRAMAVEFPVVHGHPNRLPFEGVLTLLDVASDKAPSGARGHRVVLTREAAEAALPSLLGMAVDYKAGWDGHDARQKCGIITSAEVDGRKLMVAGYLFAKDFPEFGTISRPGIEPQIQAAGCAGDELRTGGCACG